MDFESAVFSVSNILILLHSLIEAGYPSNGNPNAATAASKNNAAVHFDLNPAVFATSSDVVTKTLLTHTTTKGNLNAGAVKSEVTASTVMFIHKCLSLQITW